MQISPGGAFVKDGRTERTGGIRYSCSWLLNGYNLLNKVSQLKQLLVCKSGVREVGWAAVSRISDPVLSFWPGFTWFDLCYYGKVWSLGKGRHREWQAAGADRVRREMRISALCTICTHTPFETSTVFSSHQTYSQLPLPSISGQGGRSWRPFGERKIIPQSFRRARIYKFSRQKLCFFTKL